MLRRNEFYPKFLHPVLCLFAVRSPFSTDLFVLRAVDEFRPYNSFTIVDWCRTIAATTHRAFHRGLYVNFYDKYTDFVETVPFKYVGPLFAVALMRDLPLTTGGRLRGIAAIEYAYVEEGARCGGALFQCRHQDRRRQKQYYRLIFLTSLPVSKWAIWECTGKILGKGTGSFTPPQLSILLGRITVPNIFTSGTVDCLWLVSSLELDNYIVFPIHVLTLLIPTIIRASAAKCLAACRKLGTIYVFGVKPNVFALYTAGLAGRESQEHLDVPPHLLSCLATIRYCRSKAGSRPGKVQSYPDAHTHSTLLQRYLGTNESCVSHKILSQEWD